MTTGGDNDTNDKLTYAHTSRAWEEKWSSPNLVNNVDCWNCGCDVDDAGDTGGKKSNGVTGQA